MMKLRSKLLELARIVADHAKRDDEFAHELSAIFGIDQRQREEPVTQSSIARRPKNRRPPAAFDPVAVIRASGEAGLRSRLSELTLNQLRDIVADYGMDPGKLVMKWKTKGRVADRILEISSTRAQKGDAFRTESDPRRVLGLERRVKDDRVDTAEGQDLPMDNLDNRSAGARDTHFSAQPVDDGKRR